MGCCLFDKHTNWKIFCNWKLKYKSYTSISSTKRFLVPSPINFIGTLWFRLTLLSLLLFALICPISHQLYYSKPFINGQLCLEQKSLKSKFYLFFQLQSSITTIATFAKSFTLTFSSDTEIFIFLKKCIQVFIFVKVL